MTKKEIANELMELLIELSFEPENRRECEAFRLANKHTKAELLAKLDAAKDYRAWREKMMAEPAINGNRIH